MSGDFGEFGRIVEGGREWAVWGAGLLFSSKKFQKGGLELVVPASLSFLFV